MSYFIKVSQVCFTNLFQDFFHSLISKSLFLHHSKNMYFKRLGIIFCQSGFYWFVANLCNVFSKMRIITINNASAADAGTMNERHCRRHLSPHASSKKQKITIMKMIFRRPAHIHDRDVYSFALRESFVVGPIVPTSVGIRGTEVQFAPQ